jgi:hypothetical protein
VRLHGGVPSHKRGDLIARFRDDPDCRLFFSTDAGGVGLNLQFASTLINLEYPWNPAVLEQRIARVHRLGQREPVHVILLVAENSIETRIEAVIGAKRELFQAAILPDCTVDEVAAPQSCLSLAQALFVDRDAVEEAVAPDGMEAPPEEEPAPPQEAAPVAAPSVPPLLGPGPESPPAPVAAAVPAAAPWGDGRTGSLDPTRLPDLLGTRLDRVVQLADGRLVAVVDSLDEVTRAAAEACGALPMPRAAMEPLAMLGEASPLARAKVVAEGLGSGAAAETERRAHAALVAARRLRAAEAMVAADLSCEAVSTARDAMLAAVGGLTPEPPPADLPPARLLFEVLVPSGHLTLELAALVAKADGLARAYGTAAVPPPMGIALSVIDDARRIVAALHEPPPGPGR